MSSCFSVDVSYTFQSKSEYAYCYFSANNIVQKARKHLPIIAGSGSYQNSTMHTGVGPTNYVSYYVKRLEFSAVYNYSNDIPDTDRSFPDYAVLFKIPYREPLVDDLFRNISDFILYKEPEKVLGYDLTIQRRQGVSSLGKVNGFNITVTKPFIVGPNDYVGVFYVVAVPYSLHVNNPRIQGTAKVWFDPV